MKEVLGFTDMNILQNNGPIAGQTVFHFHIHLIPRREGDGINVTWTPGEPTDEQIAARKGLGNEAFPDRNPQRGLCPLEENCAFQGLPMERISLFFCPNKLKTCFQLSAQRFNLQS